MKAYEVKKRKEYRCVWNKNQFLNTCELCTHNYLDVYKGVSPIINGKRTKVCWYCRYNKKHGL